MFPLSTVILRQKPRLLRKGMKLPTEDLSWSLNLSLVYTREKAVFPFGVGGSNSAHTDGEASHPAASQDSSEVEMG